jgi:hypothetical protein
MDFSVSKRQKPSPVHGVVSTILFIVLVAIDVTVIMADSLIPGLIYLALVAASAALLIYAYCAKCPCRIGGCGHVLPGKLTQWLPQRKEGPYTPLDYAGTGLALALIILTPQPWLVRMPLVLALTWGLLAWCGMEIALFVCVGCGNRFCPLRRI